MILLQTALSADSPFLLNMTVNSQFLVMLNQQNKALSAFFVKTNSNVEFTCINLI